MHKFIYIYISFVCFSLMATTSALAQQTSLFSNYLLNDFILNPATAGKNDYNLIQTTFRYQWVGIKDAPKTLAVSANIPLKPKRVGLGGYLFTDDTGPIVQTGINFSYAYHIDIAGSYKLSMGLHGGMLQYKIDGQGLILADEQERYLFDAVESTWSPDASFGTYFYGKGLFAGISLNHLVENKIYTTSFDKSSGSFGRLSRHVFIMGGYRYSINDFMDLESSSFIKYSTPSLWQLDLSTRIFYQNQIWLGLSYRTNDAFIVMAGYFYKNKINIAYSYDFTTSGIRNYSDGSHEIILEYKFYKKEKEEKPEIRRALE